MKQHFGDQRFRLASSHLSPAVIRVGGITADWVHYSGFGPDNQTNAASEKPVQGAAPGPYRRLGYWPTKEENLTANTVVALYDFLAAANLSLMLDLNELHGRDCQHHNPGCGPSSNPYCNAWCSGEWDTSNVRQLLQHLHDRDMASGSSPLYAFELGNELISHMPAEQTTDDIVRMASIIQDIWKDRPADERPGLYVSYTLSFAPRLPPVLPSTTLTLSRP